MKHLGDIELFNRIQAGDRNAFSELITRYSEILFHFVHRRVSCVEESENILQEVFVDVWNQRQKITLELPLYRYLFKIAKIKVIEWIVNEQRKIVRAEILLTRFQRTLLSSKSEEELLAEELAVLSIF